MLGKSASGGLHHGVGDAACARGYDAEPDGGENVDVVALRDGDLPACVAHRGEREPVASKALPSVQLIRSPALASDFSVGLESGRMMGRGTFRAISRTIGSVKEPATVESPMRMLASILETTSAREICPLELGGQSARRSEGCAYTRCSPVRSVRPVCRRPLLFTIQKRRRASRSERPSDSSALRR